MFKINKNTKIYVYCEPKYATGGTEALHQLVDKLKKFGHNAYVLYSYETEDPKPKAYSHYNTPHVFSAEDKENNIIIIPEGAINQKNNYSKIQIGLWWLSVDNAQTNIGVMGHKVNKKFANLRKSKFAMEIYKLIYKKRKVLFDFKDKKNERVIHLAQSRYAEDYLNKNNAAYVYPLSDFLNKSHFNEKELPKENNILYNPKKGFEITKKLIKLDSSLNWKAIEKMTPSQVSELMAKSKVYIDFGDHPGKDRMPREAAMKKCCVIVGLRGSARYYSDVTIPAEYKFSVHPPNLNKILDKIKDCLNNYEENIKKFSAYPRIIKTNEKQFELEVWQIFGRGPNAAN